jgi:hypothetical protein
MAMQADPEAYAEFVEELSALTMATTERGLSTMAMGLTLLIKFHSSDNLRSRGGFS